MGSVNSALIYRGDGQPFSHHPRDLTLGCHERLTDLVLPNEEDSLRLKFTLTRFCSMADWRSPYVHSPGADTLYRLYALHSTRLANLQVATSRAGHKQALVQL